MVSRHIKVLRSGQVLCSVYDTVTSVQVTIMSLLSVPKLIAISISPVSDIIWIRMVTFRNYHQAEHKKCNTR